MRPPAMNVHTIRGPPLLSPGLLCSSLLARTAPLAAAASCLLRTPFHITMHVVCAPAVLLLSLVTRAGAFAFSSAPSDSCFQGTINNRRSSNSGRRSLASRRAALRCSRRDMRRRNRHDVSFGLSSSRQHSRQVGRQLLRRHGLAVHPPAAATATATSRTMHQGDANGEEEEEEDGLDQARRRLPQQQQQPNGRGQQSRADFLRTGASMAGFAGAVLGAQQEVGELILQL